MSWDERYSADHYIYGTDPNDFLAENIGLFPRGKVLCLADGEGRNGVYLASQGFQVTSVDGSGVALQKARALADKNGVEIEFIQADLNDYDIGTEVWDGIVSIFCHVPEPLRQKLHAGVVRGLKSGGVLLQEAYIPRQLEYNMGGPPTVDLMYSAEILRNDLTGLQFNRLAELDRQVIEGTHHFGKGAVVQVIATKP